MALSASVELAGILAPSFVKSFSIDAGTSRARFLSYLKDMHGAMAYRQNHVIEDATGRDPGWDAVVELWWRTREAMESAWLTPEGQAATDDLGSFADLDRTFWAIVDEHVRR